MLQTIVVYNLMLIFGTGFAYLYSKSANTSSSNIFLVLSFLSICIPAVIRYDVGPDYSVYLEMFKNYRCHIIDSDAKEYSLYLINRMFFFLERGYIGVIGVFFTVSLAILYRITNKSHLHYSVFFFMVLPVGYFTFDDQIRQVLAIVIFMYSVRFIERKNLRKYLICIGLATFFHYSAIVLFPIYYLARINFSTRTSIIIIISFSFLFVSGTSQHIIKEIYQNMPFYSEYANKKQYLGIASLNTGLGVLIYVLVYSISIVYKSQINRPVLTNILLIGIVLYLFSSGNLNIERISKYFLAISLYTMAILFSGKKKTNFFIIKTVILFLLLILFEKTIIFNKASDYPYRTIFSKEAEKEYLAPKNWQ